MSRRQALAALVTVGAAAAAGCGRVDAAPPSPRVLDFAALEDRHDARIGVHAVDLAGLASIEHRADERYAMCSTFKPYAAARVLQLAGAGEVTLDAAIPVSPADIVVNSPVSETRVGGTMTLREICEAALINSDNTAGNLLLRTIGGPPAATAFARSVGDQQSRLDRWEPELNTALPGDPRDTTTPRALGQGYRELLTGTALALEPRTQLEDWMRANVTSGKRFRAGLPPGWTSADKTGAGDYGSTNDAGLLLGPDGQRIVVAVLTRSRADHADAPALNDAIADTVRGVLREFGYAA